MLTRLLALLAVLLLAPSLPAHANARSLSLESASLGFFTPNRDFLKEIPDLTHCCIKEKSTERAESSNRREEYLRARYMDPGQGRFLGMDPWGGEEHLPITLHPTVYANGEPIQFTDSSGLAANLSETNTIVHQSAAMTVRPIATGAIRSTFSRTFVGVARLGIRAIRHELKRCIRSRGRQCRILIPIIVAGNDFAHQMKHIADAQSGNGDNLGHRRITPVLNYQDSRINRRSWPPRIFPSGFSVSRNGPNGLPACTAKDKVSAAAFFGSAVQCDEYPFSASMEGGYSNYKKGRVSARFIPQIENETFGRIYIRAGTARLRRGDNYLVVPSEDYPSMVIRLR